MHRTGNLSSLPDATAIRVWDLPTRLFHWLLVAAVASLIVTGQTGVMTWHFYCGYFVLSLLLFRIVWGFVGGHWSRFRQFVPTPSTLKRYLCSLVSGRHQPAVGHNPMGALSVLAMLLVLLAQVFSGFMSDDEIASSGPWAAWASGAWIAWATRYHADIGKFVLLALVLLHIGSVVFYKRVKREDLITPMVLGDKALSPDTPASHDTPGSRLLALAVWACCAGVVYALAQFAP